MYKSKLQELCHKNRWALPIYSGMKDGPEHNPQFKASVVVSGTNFDSVNICKSLKEAYNEAAELAFLHFSSEGELTHGGTNVEQAVTTMDMNSQVRTIQDDGESTHGGTKVEPAVKGVRINVNPSNIQDGSLNITAEQKSNRTQKRPEIHPDSLNMEHDLQQKFKPKLQIYAQRNNLGLPLYHSTREGASNSLRFRTTVTVGGDSFESPGSYMTIRQAEDAAAQVALMALSTDAFRENNIRLYKNLLQEFARSEGFFMPHYKTTRIGEAHDPTFYATVEVDGETFHANPAKSKKQAELNAAKVAYTAFMQRKSCQTGDISSSSSKDEVLKLPHLNLHNLADMRGKHNSKSQSLSTSSARYEAATEVIKADDEETVFSENVQEKTRFEMKEAISVPLDTGMCFQTDDFSSSSSDDEVLKLTPRTSSYSITNPRGNPKSICPTVSTSTVKYEAQTQASKGEDEETVFNKNISAKAEFKAKENPSVSSYKDSSTMKMTTEIKSYLLNNRIRVHRYIPDVASLKGNVVLPIAEDKWVVASLEFPN